MAIVTLFFALLGFLSPAHCGDLLLSIKFIFTFMGVVAGDVAAKSSNSEVGKKVRRSQREHMRCLPTTRSRCLELG